MAGCCPLPTAMTTISTSSCAFNLNQVHRVWFVREGEVIFDIGTPANNVPAAIVGDAPEDVTPWDTLKVAADSTKVIYLPLFGGDPIVTPGEEISKGGNDNSTLDGKKKHISFAPSSFTARLDGLAPAQEKEISEIVCEGDTLEVYFILHDKSIVGTLDALTSNLFTGIPVASAVILHGRAVNGNVDDDTNVIEFQLAKDWTYELSKRTPTFNTLTY